MTVQILFGTNIVLTLNNISILNILLRNQLYFIIFTEKPIYFFKAYCRFFYYLHTLFSIRKQYVQKYIYKNINVL